MFQSAAEQFLFIGERQVQALAGHTGGAGHVVHRGLAITESSKDPDRGVEQGGETRFRSISGRG
jgi:hypothetical protein